MWVPLPEQLDIFGWSVRRCPSNNQRWILILVQIPAHHTENVVYITLFRLPSRFCSRLTKIPWPNQAVGTTILNSGGSWFFCFQGFLLNWHPMAGRYASCQVPPCMPSERGTFFFLYRSRASFRRRLCLKRRRQSRKHRPHNNLLPLLQEIYFDYTQV